MKVYFNCHSVDYEGSDVISVHATLESANMMCEQDFNEALNRWGNYYNGNIKNTEVFCGKFSDSTYYVEIREVLE